MKKLKSLNIIKGICFAGMILLLCFVLFLLPASASEKKVIRVAYPIQERFTEIDENNRRHGYTYDYLAEIARYTDWQYEFVDLEGDLNEQLDIALTMLENGEVDLMGGMVFNSALGEIYDYSGYNYGTSYWILASHTGNTLINSDNYYLEQPLKVAVSGSKKTANTTLQSFAEMSGIQVEQIFCETDEEMLELVKNGDADAFLSKSVSFPYGNYKTLASFSPQPFYFATTKGNKDIVNELNQALLSISQNNPYFALKLQNTYFMTENIEFQLTDAEQTYIEQTNSLKTAVLGGKPPLQYINAKTGEYMGVSLDVLDYISAITGLRFDVYMTEDFDEYANLVESGSIDICLGINNELYQYEWQNMACSMSYLESALSIVLTDKTAPADISGKTLAISRGVFYDGEYEGNAVYFETTADCLNAVQSGAADYCYSNTYTAQYYTSNPKFKDLIVLPQVEEWEQNFCFGVVDADNDILLSILNKTINHLNEEGTIKSFLYDNAYQMETVTFSDFFASNPVEVIMSILVLLLLFLSIILLINVRREKSNQHLRRLENQRYEQICEISNEFLFEYNVKEDKLKMSEKCSEFLELPGELEHIVSSSAPQLDFIRFLIGHEYKNTELQISRPDGSQYWIRISTKQVTDSYGNVIYLVGKMLDIQKEIEEKEILQEKAEKDFLTGMYNISAFRERTQILYEKFPEGKFAFCILDIDYFKQVNDSFGHFAGDRVLKAVADVLKQAFNLDTEVTARLGGDEFVVLTLCSDGYREISEKCERLRSMIEALQLENAKIKITVSIGIALTDAFTDFDTIYKRADNALYQVKEDGRNGYRIVE